MSYCIHQVEGYTTSKDYALLARLARTSSVICIVDYLSGGRDTVLRDVGHTLFQPGNPTEVFQISARGISYIYAFNEAEFIASCKTNNVEFLEPK